jgi:hypothetical protein
MFTIVRVVWVGSVRPDSARTIWTGVRLQVQNVNPMAGMHCQIRDWANEDQIVGPNFWCIIATDAYLASIKDPIAQYFSAAEKEAPVVKPAGKDFVCRIPRK